MLRRGSVYCNGVAIPGDTIPTYYSASAAVPFERPRLNGAERADVCVIGGGFSGIATALTLAERGLSVIVLEAGRLGNGASGRNGGQLIAGISGEAEIRRQLGADGAKLLRDIRYRGHQIIEERVARYAIDCDLKRGWMEVATRPRHLRALKAHVAAMIEEGNGHHLRVVEPENMGAFLATRAYHGGYIDSRSGHLHPLKLCLGEARAAESLGVRIFEGSRATAVRGGAHPRVETDMGSVEAKHVVVGGEIYDRFGIDRLAGLMVPTGSYIIATEPLGADLAREINPQDLAVADSNVVLDYFRLTADKRMLFGGRCNYTNRDPRDIAAVIGPRMRKIFPQLEDRRVDFAWGGRIAIVVNRVPAIGRADDNLYFLQGYCGHGVNATHIAGEIVADAICGDRRRLDLFDRIRHRRLPFSDYLGNPLLAAGMLYYRMRDVF